MKGPIDEIMFLEALAIEAGEFLDFSFKCFIYFRSTRRAKSLRIEPIHQNWIPNHHFRSGEIVQLHAWPNQQR